MIGIEPIEPLDARHLNEIKLCCEKLISETETDLKLFKHEQNQLKQKILETIEENSKLNDKLEELNVRSALDTTDDASTQKINVDVVSNVKKQIDCLAAENHELNALNEASKKTIENLENEVKSYREHLFDSDLTENMRRKYQIAVRVLEATIQSQKIEIQDQNKFIEDLLAQQQVTREHIEKLEQLVKEKRSDSIQSNYNNNVPPNTYQNSCIIETLKAQLEKATKHIEELEHSLKISKEDIGVRFEREKCALEKVQEALSIAEAAVADKNEAQRRERIIKEECDSLASTIAQVMDEAARKVELDMTVMRQKFNEKEKAHIETNIQLNEELLNQKKYNQILETRCNRFENKFKNAMQENEKLTNQLKSATTKLDELMFKLEANESLLKESENLKRLAQEREREIQDFITTNRQLKQKYKCAIEDITRKFEKEVHRLQNENATINAENQCLKLQHNYPLNQYKFG